jgi:cbb3-type cytochrome oxidase subunit 3
MHKEILVKFGLENTWMPITALLIFTILFSLITILALRKENKNRFEEAQGLPLTDGEQHE